MYAHEEFDCLMKKANALATKIYERRDICHKCFDEELNKMIYEIHGILYECQDIVEAYERNDGVGKERLRNDFIAFITARDPIAWKGK